MLQHPFVENYHSRLGWKGLPCCLSRSCKSKEQHPFWASWTIQCCRPCNPELSWLCSSGFPSSLPLDSFVPVLPVLTAAACFGGKFKFVNAGVFKISNWMKPKISIAQHFQLALVIRVECKPFKNFVICSEKNVNVKYSDWLGLCSNCARSVQLLSNSSSGSTDDRL